MQDDLLRENMRRTACWTTEPRGVLSGDAELKTYAGTAAAGMVVGLACVVLEIKKSQTKRSLRLPTMKYQKKKTNTNRGPLKKNNNKKRAVQIIQ